MKPVIRAVLIADSSGFSRLAENQGIAAARAHAKRFWEAGRIAAAMTKGRFVKGWADNVAIVFDDVPQAVLCGQALAQVRQCGVGIGYGEVLLERRDVWGVEVNRASKLGEDQARAGEMLFTDAARERMRALSTSC